MPKIQEKQYLFITVLLASVSGPIMLSGVNVALPTIGTELSMNAIELSWIQYAFNLTLVVCTLPLARLADITGRKRIYTIGTLLLALSTLLSALSNSSLMLISLRVVQGMSLAMVWGTATALLSAAYPHNERGKVLGWNVAAVYLGVSIGPTIGGLLTQNLGWRSVFYLGFILQIPVAALLLTKVRAEWAEAKGEKYDIIGSLLFSATIFFLMYGFSLLPSMDGIVLIAIGIAGVLAFIIWELRVENPTLNMRLFARNRMFAFSGLSQLLFQGAVFPVSFILSLYLQYIRGLSPQDAGFVLLAQPVMQVVFSPLAGKLSDKIQPRILASIGIAVSLAGILLLLNATKGTALLPFILSLVLIGFGTSLFASPNTNAIMSSIERKYYGVASAFQATSRDIGITLGMGIVMLLFSLFMGAVQVTPEYYGAFVESIRMALVIFAMASFCCLFVSAARGKLIHPAP
jgi:EmrB/QacA subfamily drug resistance transporter